MRINILSSGLSKGLLDYYFLTMANEEKMLVSIYAGENRTKPS